MNWLYGVAYQTAQKAQARSIKRKRRETLMAVVPDAHHVPPRPSDEQLTQLDRALYHLPEKYRTPIVLCELNGMTHQDAARQLGCRVVGFLRQYAGQASHARRR
jgi:RNA polymerase sigma-70 factor (ECF subfamily)